MTEDRDDPAARAADEVMDEMADEYMGGLIDSQVRDAVERMEARMRAYGGPAVSFDTQEVDGYKLEQAAELLAEAGADISIEMDAPGTGTMEYWRFSTRHADRPGEWLRQLQRENHEWRKDAVPGAFDLSCVGHVVGEAAELQDLYVKAAEYEGHEVDEAHAKEEAGDIIVALLSLLSIEGWDVVECIMRAKGKNADRDWDDHTGRSR